jgi:hypothetical protein
VFWVSRLSPNGNLECGGFRVVEAPALLGRGLFVASSFSLFALNGLAAAV